MQTKSEKESSNRTSTKQQYWHSTKTQRVETTPDLPSIAIVKERNSLTIPSDATRTNKNKTNQDQPERGYT